MILEVEEEAIALPPFEKLRLKTTSSMLDIEIKN